MTEYNRYAYSVIEVARRVAEGATGSGAPVLEAYRTWLRWRISPDVWTWDGKHTSYDRAVLQLALEALLLHDSKAAPKFFCDATCACPGGQVITCLRKRGHSDQHEGILDGGTVGWGCRVSPPEDLVGVGPCERGDGHDGAHVDKSGEAWGDECHSCWRCLGSSYPRMVLCATCGNKRCPKAADHSLACTNSNAPGQPGSAYP